MYEVSRQAIIALLAALALGACHATYSEPIDLAQSFRLSKSTTGSASIQSAFLSPDGNYSLVMVRHRPDVLTQDLNREIVCSSPSPDWATALATARQVQAAASVPSGASGSLAFNSSATETITALAGRTAGVVALRDGLYKACEAYSNGVIGKDAYALILSQYGNLLIGLAGSSGSTSGSTGMSGTAMPAAGMPAGIAVSLSAASPASETKGAGMSGSSGMSPQGIGAVPAVIQALQQHVGTLLVACINENDPSLHAINLNPLLTPAFCQGLLTDIMTSVRFSQTMLPSILKAAMIPASTVKPVVPPVVHAARAAKPPAGKPGAPDARPG